MFSSFTTTGRVRNILKLLTEERKIILKGPISDLSRIAMRRDKLVEGLVSGRIVLAEGDINAIRCAADRNRTLLEATLSGAQFAKRLLAEQRSAVETMGTYTDSGERLEAPLGKDLSDRVV